WANRKDGVIVFKKPNIFPAVSLLILQYIYTGVLDLTNQSGFIILALLVASDELFLNKLVDYVQKHLINEESSWLKNIPLSLCTQFLSSKEFSALDKDIFLKLVMRDDLDIEEIDTWKYLIKWGTAQSAPKGKSKADVANWGDNDFASFKRFLDPFIPHIRFHEISRDDFYFHVRPYKKAIPENLYEDLVAYLMANVNPKVSKLPSRCGSINIDSVIIERDKAAAIINWIEKRAIFARKPLYQFRLTYRATRDGFDYNKFMANNCSGAILGLIKVSDSERIIGGYNPLGLRNNAYNYNRGYYGSARWEATNDSFIFCFENVNGSDTHILSRVRNSAAAIYSYDANWLNFGNSDLILNGQNGSCTQSQYEKKISNVRSNGLFTKISGVINGTTSNGLHVVEFHDHRNVIVQS
ncbi:29857_t:CDS:2, partial [Racocetra persica]